MSDRPPATEAACRVQMAAETFDEIAPGWRKNEAQVLIDAMDIGEAQRNPTERRCATCGRTLARCQQRGDCARFWS